MAETSTTSDEAALFEEQVFDFHQVFEDRVAGQTIVYLDNNAWIDLRDANDGESRSCLEICFAAVDRNLAVFPVSYASVSELYNVPDEKDRIRQAELMDRLSRHVTLRAADHVYALEATASYHYFMHGRAVSVARNVVFSSLPDYLGDSQIGFPNGWTRENAETFMRLARGSDEFRSLSWFIRHLDFEEHRRRHAVYRARYIAGMTQQLETTSKMFRKGTKLDREKILNRERAALFEKYVRRRFMHAASREYGTGALAAIQRHGSGSAERTALLFQFAMPTLELHAQAMTDVQMNPGRRTRWQDFWDIEHVAAAPVYADVFVTRDNWLRDRIAALDKMPWHRRAIIVASLGELASWLVQQMR